MVIVNVITTAVLTGCLLYMCYQIYNSRISLLTETIGPTPSDTDLQRPTEDNFKKGRISNVELWKLVVFSAESEEKDKLLDAIRKLTPGTHDITNEGNLIFFQHLCRWKTTCAVTEQMDKLFEACSYAGMGETVQKLKDFRCKVSERVSACDLEHILWQIGKSSSGNITTLLNNLTRSLFNHESSVSENVRRTLPELQKWENGNHAINPAVMLGLQSDDWCDEDMYFFTVAEEDKCPLTDADIKQHVRNVSRAHCKKIISIISTNGKSKRKKEEKDVNSIVDENKTDLFDTYEMIKEWLDEQKCSNYEKRSTLRNAVENAKRASTSNEIKLGEIKVIATSKGNAEAAYELLMKDIKPFATSLGLDESKLTKYSRLSSSSQSNRGTIGLVADVMAIKRKKIF